MKNIAYSLFLLTFLLYTASCKKNRDTEKPIEKNIDKEIENWLSKTGIPSTSIVLFKNGNVLKSKAYGYSNLKTKTLANTSTIYNTGSNFKSVTATAIMQLEEKGLIDIDKPINTYLKEPIKYFNKNTPITARHLMSHQSGIPSSIGINKVWERKPNRTLREIVTAIKPTTKPDEKHIYSNDGYALLGLLIEDVTGLTYEEYIWKNILDPLGIETFGFLRPTPEMIEDLALPYHIRYNQAYPTNQLHLEQYPAGDIFLKPIDMAKFLMMHLNEGEISSTKILSKKSVEKMHLPNLEVEENFYYGLGFGIDQIDGKNYSYHQGSLPGYLSVFQIDFETKTGVYITSNVSSSPIQDKQINLLLKYLFEYVKNDNLKRDLEVPINKKTPVSRTIKLGNYIGKYKIEGAPVYLTIDKIGNQLFLINPAKERFRIESLNSNRFFITTENEDIEFKENKGNIESLKIFSMGKEINAKKE
ncbi:serine hydrolase domain-containing protein [Aquimarina algiphila]|uniref:serine hydrolase domain-containing protein n=1 Tax=Aquimarina algiphila TaxID=2047982 RepID=UPI00232F7BE2|nr:serine hydrolase domain-containing protein [Aquimarina algiphila]